MKAEILNVKQMPKAVKIPAIGDAKEKTKPELILELFKNVQVHTSFFKYAAPKLSVSPSTIRINWFHMESFPAAKQDAIIQVLNDYLKTQ